MIKKIKSKLYFIVAWYFRFFAEIKLRNWKPRVIVITGSTGKTSLLHLVEAQLGDKSKYSHHANSSMGIPFDILDLKRKTLTWEEWPILFLLAPLKIFNKAPSQKIYVVEADCDRPYEGNFLSNLLTPEVSIWTNVSKTHTMNFENLVIDKKFTSVEKAIAYEFGYFVERTTKLVIMNEDNEFEDGETLRARCEVQKVSARKKLVEYSVNMSGTEFNFGTQIFKFKYIFPKEIATSILMCQKLVDYLGFAFDNRFLDLKLPPGRNSVFKGIKDITIVDSAYNASLNSMAAILFMFSKIDSKNKWVVLGDMLEQGREEANEHKSLGKVVGKYSFEKIILIGPRVIRYTYPYLLEIGKNKNTIETFINPKDVLDYLKNNISGGEMILFKGARFLEGVIENLLLNKDDAKNLGRREKVWEIRRKKWGLKR